MSSFLLNFRKQEQPICLLMNNFKITQDMASFLPKYCIKWNKNLNSRIQTILRPERPGISYKSSSCKTHIKLPKLFSDLSKKNQKTINL